MFRMRLVASITKPSGSSIQPEISNRPSGEDAANRQLTNRPEGADLLAGTKLHEIDAVAGACGCNVAVIWRSGEPIGATSVGTCRVYK